MPEKIFLQGENVVLEFPDGTPDEVIKKTIRREYPMTGEEVAGHMMHNPEWFTNDLTLDEYKSYRKWKGEQDLDFGQFGDTLKTIGGEMLGAAGELVTSPLDTAQDVPDAFALGTKDLVRLGGQIVDWFGREEDTYDQFLDGKRDTHFQREEYDRKLRKDMKNEQGKINYFAIEREKMISGEIPIPTLWGAAEFQAQNPDFVRGGANVLDPSVFFGGFFGKAFTKAASKVAAQSAGKAVSRAGKMMKGAGDLAAGIMDRGAAATGRMVEGATGMTPGMAKGAVLGTGVGTGVMAAGAPVVAGTIGAVKGLQVGGRVLAEAGEGLQRGVGREGFFGGAAERIGQGNTGYSTARGLSLLDTPLEYGATAAGGMVAGAGVGAGLGGLAEGWQGAIAGAGGGTALGGIGGTIGHGIGHLSGAALRQKRATDVRAYLEGLPDHQRPLVDAYIKQHGADQTATILDTARFFKSIANDADVIFVDKPGDGTPRGYVLTVEESSGKPTLTVNLSKLRSDHTIGHELFHGLAKIEQMQPMAENIRREIAGLWSEGKLLEEGMLPAGKLDQYFDDYIKMLPKAERDAAVKAHSDTRQKRAEYVADEIAAEHMAALITGGTKGRGRYDKMLRAFDTPVRKMVDWAVLKENKGILARTITRFADLGFTPGKSMLFPDMAKASPTLNALMRDMIRARKNMRELVVGADETFNGRKLTTIIRKQDMKHPHIQKELEQLGLLKDDGKGGRVMKDDKDYAAEFEASEAAVTDILRRGGEGGMRIDTIEKRDGTTEEVVRGSRFSPEQISELQANTTILPHVKRNVAAFNEAVSNGLVMDMTYFAATSHKTNRLTGKSSPKYSSGLKRSHREVLPYKLYITDKGNFVVKAIDWTKLWTDTAALAVGKNLGLWDNNHVEFLGDFVAYLNNLSADDPKASAALFGKDKADFMHDRMEGGGRKSIVKDFRLDRMDGLAPTFRKAKAPMSEQAWARSQARMMPDRVEQGVMRRHDGSEDARYMPDDANPNSRRTAAAYAQRAGIEYRPHTDYLLPDEAHLKELADWMEKADHRPDDPAVRASYKSLRDEVMAQYETMLEAGIRPEPWDGKGEPYASSREMMADVRDNGHLWYFRTENGFGETPGLPLDHPMLEVLPHKLGGKPMLLNDVFRVVHDYYGHTQQGFQFGPRGEYNAFKEHSGLFSESAQGALAAETLAQNAWVNFGRQLRRKDGSLPRPKDADWIHPEDRSFAEQKANVVPAEIRYMPDVGKHIKAVGDSAENLRQALTRRPMTGVAKNPLRRFHDDQGRPIYVGADRTVGGKSFEGWKEEVKAWLKPEEIEDFRAWYSELRGEFIKEFGKRDADKMMMAWLGAQQNASPLTAMQNVFRVEDRLGGIISGKKGGLADAKIDAILQRKTPKGGFGAKLSDFVDSGYLRKTRTYVGGDKRGGEPFVADVHTGRDSGHLDHATLTRLVAKATSGKLLIDGNPVSIAIKKTKTLVTGGKSKKVPTQVEVTVGGEKFILDADMSSSPSGTQYEGISVWGNNLTKALNTEKWEGGNWSAAEVQAVGWMRVLRQYGLPESTVAETLLANTHRVSAEVNYGSGNVLPRIFPEFTSLPAKAQVQVTREVMTRTVKDVARIVGGSLRVRQMSVGDGYWYGEKAPSMQAFLLGSPEAAAIFRDALAYISEQAEAISVNFGKGGKQKRAIVVRNIDGSGVSAKQVDSLMAYVKKTGGEKTLQGFSAHPMPGEKGLLIAGLTEATVKRVRALIDGWRKETKQYVDGESVPAVTTRIKNDWSKQRRGDVYLSGIKRGGGTEKIRQLHDYRGRYFDLVEKAIRKHAPDSLKAKSTPEQVAQGRADFLAEPSRGNAPPSARHMPDVGGQDALGMFSAAERATVSLKQETGSAAQMLAMIKRGGVKQDELAELGLDQFLEGNRKVTKDEIIDHLVENQVTVEETVLGEPAALSGGGLHPAPRPTKHASYVEPGAVEGSYRELLLRLPEGKNTSDLLVLKDVDGNVIREVDLDTQRHTLPAEERAAILEEARTSDLARENPGSTPEIIEGSLSSDYTGGHYGEHPNVLAHVRFNDRVSDHGKTLNIEEIQSDLHQEGRKKGYQLPAREKAALESEFKSLANDRSEAANVRRDKIVDIFENRTPPSTGSVPDAPFKTSWHELAMKRMIAYAVQNNYDAISWSKGETQFNRYGSQEIAWVRDGDGWKVKATEQRGGETGGIDIEAAARAEGILREGGSRITSKEQLRDVIKKTVMERERGQWSPENFEKQVDKLTDRTWERMQNEDAGTSLPRKEGMKGFYDRMLPRMKTWKKLGLKVESVLLNKPPALIPGRPALPTIRRGNRTPREALSVLSEGPIKDGGAKSILRKLARKSLWQQVDAEAARLRSQDLRQDGVTSESWAIVDRMLNPDEPTTHIVRLTPEVKAKVLDSGLSRFMPDAAAPNTEKNQLGWSLIKGQGNKWRVYKPDGTLAGIAATKASAERMFRTKYKRELRKADK